ncbi:MAG: hypothetical protein DRI54_04800, partial [Bacteroidetes bacterium]
MKISKQQKAEVLKVYKTYFDYYIKGDVNGIAALLDEDFKQIGSAESEVFFNKKDAVKFLLDTIDQVAGKTKIKNRELKVEQLEGLTLVTDLFDIYVLDENNFVFYSKFRASTLMHKKAGSWKIIHQHSSIPDTNAEEGENIAIEKISEENRELRDAIKRRTVELEQKNRELEVEASLERVRARAMGMQNSGELADLVYTLIKELTRLDFSLTVCIINIIDEDNRSNTVWATNPETGKDPEPYCLKFEDYAFHHGMWKAWKEKKAKWVYTLEGEEKKIYDEYLFNETEFRRFSKKNKTAFRALNSYVASFTFSNFGGLQTIGDAPLSEESLDILARFGKVFDLTYTRFNDLKQAEAQAREAEIEAALERVRSRSMAMHKSEELKEVIQLVYDQFVHLNISIEHTGFIIDFKDQDNMHIWLADKQKIPSQVTIPYFDSPHWNSLKWAIKKGINFFTNKLTFKEKNKFYKKLFKFIPELTEEAQDFYLTCPGLAASTVLLDNIGLYIENFSGTPYSDEENKILMRFGKVFQQTYTRFLDLQKAEAQARESKIQLALEKVRMVALGLNKSEEMLMVTKALYEQLLKLGFANIRNAIIDINNGDDDTFTDYDYSHEMLGTVTQMSYHDDPTLEGQFQKMSTTTNDFFELVLEGKELEDLIAMRIRNGEDEDPRLLNADILTYNFFSFGNGAIGISNFGVLSAEERTILNR